MNKSLQIACGLAALVLSATLSAAAQPVNEKTAQVGPAAVSHRAVQNDATPVAAVNIEAHLKSRVVTSVTVGAPEAAAPDQAIAVNVKTAVAAR